MSAGAAGGRGRHEGAAAWVYRGVWRVLVDWLRVPEEPPRLPAGEPTAAVRPAPGFLRYLKFYFWLGLVAVDALILGGWALLTYHHPVAGAILALPAWGLAVVPDIVVYLALHLRYDTTWYLMTDRALRLRRGVWTIHETTITYENIQNVTLSQGPLQRLYGIADVVVQTAGGGGAGAQGKAGGTGHTGLIQGVADAAAIRDRILERARRAAGAGLGDEHRVHEGSDNGWNALHVDELARIRELARALANRAAAR